MNNLPFWAKALIACATCLILGSASGIITSGAIDTWYTTLDKPSFNPPNWIFGPVWTILYLMMGFAFALVWQRYSEGGLTAKRSMLVFTLQFLLNLAWTPIFFGAHNLLLALVVIVVLWILILMTTICFFQQNRLAGALMVPYLLWVSFATVLNFSLWQLN